MEKILPESKMIEMYEMMLKIRFFEEKATLLFRSGIVGGADVPVPYSASLENASIPQVDEIKDAVRYVISYS
ncbi:hypothetical protein LCGC14_2820190 [marine sediment metagenome]|uniref:Uncharacterized protein n=1 Tax=marine sediment metagenome TaxID=412755 RepID=A0A0F8YH41_9ZZZZ|nr:hypothetical protein [Spirochaetota bacterium]